MNPTLSAALATLPAHIEWRPGISGRITIAEQNYAHATIIINDIVLVLDVSYFDTLNKGRILATISSHDGPDIRVASRNRPDLLTAWTEVAEVVARVDAAAGAAMGLPRESEAAGTPPA